MAGKMAVAKALAEKHGGRYHRGRGPDIRTEKITINVETSRTLRTACGRLRGFRGPVYVACANDADIENAKAILAGKTVGLMNSKGRILKKSTRGRWP
ncbi:MAG: hypothetical protein OXE58_11090 [Acidobacteria bacterium]|nr:hypothetical protein [Acidobacteriota bacterium]